MSSVRPIWLVLVLLTLIGGGASGYYWLEGWNWSDSVYMTLMVLTTVGFNEVHPLSRPGEYFTDVLMVVGIGLMLYLLTVLAESALRGVVDPQRARRRKERRLNMLRGHTLVCGYGQVGEAVCAALKEAGRSVVVIDTDAERLAYASAHGLQVLGGDATDEEVLKRAGVERAGALVSVIHSDPANLYVVLSARGLVPELKIIARASDESAARKMRRAGASEVVNPYQLSGNRIARLMIAPHLARFLNSDLDSGHFAVREGAVPSSYVGKTIEQFGQDSGALVVAIWRNNQALRARPQEVLLSTDTLLLAGTAAEVAGVGS
ncbi:potassium channel protein [Deinococcus psychrotolerans]|uniref:Potassium channel protein n=1 Tax=Deinococcus psychrotolerans TaxID=2489213 RepID=A0A3G8YD71_9DEIO|nr:potassium channel protein [Deinococcus psychrotolerans]AZI43262.1 potassium channel protein [Deinococcus psychrotolerans]